MNDEIHSLSGAYALDALDDIERKQFEAHLDACSVCRREVDELREVLVDLAGDAAQAPPPDLRSATLQAIDAVRPLAPITESNETIAPSADEVGARRRGRFARSGRAGLLAIAAAVLLVVVGATLVSTMRDTGSPDPTAQDVMAASDARKHDVEMAGGDHALLVVSRSKNRAAFMSDALPPAPKGMAYQLWYERPDDGMVPAGMVTTTGVEAEPMVLDGDLADATAVGITMEPVAGSPEPTGEPLAVVSIT